jgi:hypothetical protein
MMRLRFTVLNLIQIVATFTFSRSFCCEKKKRYFVLSSADLAKMKRLHRSFLYKVEQNEMVTSFFPFLSWLNGMVTSFLLFENPEPFPFHRSEQITEGGRL